MAAPPGPRRPFNTDDSNDSNDSYDSLHSNIYVYIYILLIYVPYQYIYVFMAFWEKFQNIENSKVSNFYFVICINCIIRILKKHKFHAIFLEIKLNLMSD